MMCINIIMITMNTKSRINDDISRLPILYSSTFVPEADEAGSGYAEDFEAGSAEIESISRSSSSNCSCLFLSFSS